MKLVFWKTEGKKNNGTQKLAGRKNGSAKEFLGNGNGQDIGGSCISPEAMLRQLRKVLSAGNTDGAFLYFEAMKKEGANKKIIVDAEIMIGMWAVSKVRDYLKYNRPDIAKQYLECARKLNYTQFFSQAGEMIGDYEKNGISSKSVLEKSMN